MTKGINSKLRKIFLQQSNLVYLAPGCPHIVGTDRKAVFLALPGPYSTLLQFLDWYVVEDFDPGGNHHYFVHAKGRSLHCLIVCFSNYLREFVYSFYTPPPL